jgi:UDP-GlcNAc:undecaprenyl-phosphate GlcNAc-1-phosphate transferase
MSLYLAVFMVALSAALVATPLAQRAALRLDIVDRPGGRKAHHTPVPYLGGLAIYVGFMLFLVAVVVLNRTDPRTPLVQALAILAGATLMVVLGLVDDRFSLRPLLKLGGQLLSAAVLYAAGVHFSFNHFGYLDAPVSLLWVVGITNAFNLLDNMDGLSVGTAAIACTYFFVLAVLEPTKQYLVASMAAALGGACFGFLYYNFNPARIFMGDAGSLFLGFMLAVLGLKIKMNFFQNLHAVNFFVPVVVLGIPIFDTTLVTISRLRRRVPIGRGGHDHTSHRLILLGLTVREAVMAVYLVAGALGLAGILLTVANFESGMTLVALLIAGGIWAGYKLEQVYSRHLSAVSHQPSAIGPQPKVIDNHQPTADGSASSAANRQPATVPSRQDADS